MKNIVCSVDIGLRNLSLCIMGCDDKADISNYIIQLWGVYNTLDSDNHKCEAIQKNGNICGKKCSTKLDCNFYCKTHFPKSTLFNKKIHTFKIKAINDYLLQDIAKVVLEKVQYIYDTNKELFESLTSVIIELQPQVNQKMKFTSHIIYGKLVELLRHTKTTIRFVRASQKLKAYTGPYVECKLKGAYARRKKLSVEYTKWFLLNKFCEQEYTKWNTIINTPKADDLTDTFLMAINGLYGMPKKQKVSKTGKCIK